MEYTLERFCGLSRQRVNMAKSKVWILPKTLTYLKSTICTTFQVSATTYLGIYLGTPLMHKLMGKRTLLNVRERG